MNDIIIQSDTFMRITLSCPQEFFVCLDDLDIHLTAPGIPTTLIYSEFALKALNSFQDQLEAALEGKLELDEIIGDDLGLLWNRFCQNQHDQRIEYFEKAPFPLWKGTRYFLWGLPTRFQEQYITWLYTQNGNFYIEVTPTYRWHFMCPYDNEKSFTYDSFMKSYESLIKISFSCEKARELLHEVKVFMNLIHANEKQYQMSKCGQNDNDCVIEEKA